MKILDRLDQGLPPIVYGDGSQSYDFIYVTDTARANICALKADVSDTFYNVGGGVKTSIKELTELILKVTGSDLEIMYEPEGPTYVTHRIGSTENAAADIGFSNDVDLEDGIRQLIEWRNSHKEQVEARAKKAGIR
jgi:UDP-glucose 4-epimerase